MRDILVPANSGPPGKMAGETERGKTSSNLHNDKVTSLVITCFCALNLHFLNIVFKLFPAVIRHCWLDEIFWYQLTQVHLEKWPAKQKEKTVFKFAQRQSDFTIAGQQTAYLTESDKSSALFSLGRTMNAPSGC